MGRGSLAALTPQLTAETSSPSCCGCSTSQPSLSPCNSSSLECSRSWVPAASPHPHCSQDWLQTLLKYFFPSLHCCNPQGPLSLDVLLPVALCSLFLALFFLSVDKSNLFQPHCRGLFQWRDSGLYSQSRNYCSLWGGWPVRAPVCRISTCPKPVWQDLIPQCIPGPVPHCPDTRVRVAGGKYPEC